ncbi:hypothetical protein B484DRAFT_408095, partial [Ochromonadaceae sp. CCMP2298]
LTWSSVAPQYSAGEAPKPSMQPLQEGSTFRDGGCGRGRVQSSVGQLEMRAREAAGDKTSQEWFPNQ